MNLFNFEEDNLNVDDVYQVDIYLDIYNSRFAKHFVRHQGMISISTTRFGLRTGLFMLLIDINIVAKKTKEISKATSLSQLYKAGVQNRHIMAISVHSNEHSLVSCNKRPSEDELSDRMLRHYLAKP